MSHSTPQSCTAKGCCWRRGWAQMLPWGRGLQWCQRLGAPPAAGQTALPVPWPCSCNDQMSLSDLTPLGLTLGSPIASESIWKRCQITSLSVAPVAQLASGKMEGGWQKQDLSQCNVFLFLLCQAALDHTLACQNGFACWLGCGQRDTGVQEHSSASSSSQGCPTRTCWDLAPAQLLQLRVTMHTLTKYLQTQAAVATFNFMACTRCCILSQWEWDLDFSPVCPLSCAQSNGCCWCEGSSKAGAASPAPPNLPSLFPQFVHLTGPLFPYKLPLLWLQLPPSLASLPIPRQMHLSLLLSFPPVHAHMSAVPDSEENIWFQQCP